MDQIIELIGIIAAIFTTVAFFPQTIRVMQTKSTQDLSWWWIVVMAIGAFIWLIYGILITSIGLIIANSTIVTCLIIMIRYKFVYENSPPK